uniref:CRAL-TRIO domain-containing protein n=1 Tax=Brassica campestris TaxID=3711 RepID=M4EDE2_BRACM
MEESQELALTQLRKSVEKLSSSTEGYEKPTLMRFLIARSMNPNKAAKMFVDWQKWRASMIPPSGFIPDSEVKDELETRKMYLQGPTKSGQPLVVCKVSKHFPAKDQLHFKKFLVHVLDKSIASAIQGKEVGDEKVACLIDLQNITYKNLDARGTITGFQILQIVIVTDGEEQQKLEEEVGLDALPEEYGGRAKLTAFQDVLLPLTTP